MRFIICLFFIISTNVFAEEQIPKVGMTDQEALNQSIGCLDCHTKTDAFTMHKSNSVVLGCASCHGGRPEVRAGGLSPSDPEYIKAKETAHVLPNNKELWSSSRNPERTYSKSMNENAEFIRFVNPGDLRVSQESCGGCHAEIVNAVKSSIMTTSAMLWQGASYNNGILPFKIGVLGENYTKDGEPQSVKANENYSLSEFKKPWAIKQLLPLPAWEVTEPGDVFRVFERGGLFNNTQFPDLGNPNPLEDPGKPDNLASNRGPGTGARISVPVLNIHKTRLNGPHLSQFGTNDNPGDYRSSGCSACHVVYANERGKVSASIYAEFGQEGKSQTEDPTIPKDESGHPLKHEFTRAIPTSQCMVCHMHQPNVFVNSYLGYTMWDYESDAKFMWPEKQKYPSYDEIFEVLDRNPEEASIRGKWSERDFLKRVSELNPKLENTQFADYHGHGWNFRAIYKKDRKGNLIDKDDKLVSQDDPDKFKKAVHLMDIHAEKGMQCVDCHFSRDSHGDGNLYSEVAHAVEIGCEDCHGTVKSKTNLRSSGPAAPPGGSDLSLLRTSFGKPKFEWQGDKLIQNSNLDPNLKWEVKQVINSVSKDNPNFNLKSYNAKMTKKFGEDSLAHPNEEMSCFTCHSSWATSCAGCHLPIKANWKQSTKHYESKDTRNWATYNPQVVRDEMFQIGRHGPAKNNKIVPVRSSSALVLSSEDINRQKIYVQQPPIASSGYSSQAFAPHFPHTVRKTETKNCNDCHLSKANDNNAIMAQLLLLGTNYVSFMGYHAYVATGEEGLEAVQVTEWDEPQAVIGSYLHKYAYPDWYKAHQDRNKELVTSHAHHSEKGITNQVQLRGEYLFTTSGEGGFRVYDVANIANKGFSERIVSNLFSPLGHDTHVSTKNAMHFALPTVMPVSADRKVAPENLEQEMHPIYHYAAIVDAEEGLILVNVDTFTDKDRTNNFLDRALTWNENNILTGAKYITLAGHHAFILTNHSLVIVDLNEPLKPKVLSELDYDDPTAIEIQFRYGFVTDKNGFHVIELSNHAQPMRVLNADIKLEDLRGLYLARTYAYVAGGKNGLYIIDIEKPESPKVYMQFTDDGRINDLYDIKVASTNASAFAYLADGVNGLKVLQLTDPDTVPTYYGFSPEVKPYVIAIKKTEGPALNISKPLDRDRAVDETGNQVSIFGRVGSRPFNMKEMERLYKKKDGSLYYVD